MHCYFTALTMAHLLKISLEGSITVTLYEHCDIDMCGVCECSYMYYWSLHTMSTTIPHAYIYIFGGGISPL